MFKYPKMLNNLDRLKAFFGISYGKELATIIAREPTYTYMAFLTQTGTDAPVPQVLFSNLETDPVFSYDGPGMYKVSHPLIQVNKTIISFNPSNAATNGYQVTALPVTTEGETRIIVVSYDGMSLVDDALLNNPIKIEIWL